MAYEFLPTNFKDDIINAEINERRKYRMIQNDDGTVSFEDVVGKVVATVPGAGRWALWLHGA